MATLTAIAEGPGKAARRPLMSGGPRVMQIRHYSFDFDSSYPTGGESISTVFDDFQASGVVQIFVSTVSNRVVTVDYSGKKLLLYTALGTEAGSGTDQSSITGVKLTAIGYPA